MIKCPRCGSTAQLRQIGSVTVSEHRRYFCEVYECGCSCTFEILFPRREIEDCFIGHVWEDLSDE